MKPAGIDLRVPPDEVVQSVLDAYDRGQCLEAFQRAEAFAPLSNWGGIDSGTVALRIANNIGAPRLAREIAVRMWRTEPMHPLAQFEYALQYLHFRGPLRLWLQFAKWPKSNDGRIQWQADLLALKSWVASDLRDFDAAEKFLAEAESLDESLPWVRLQRAHMLEKLDQVEEALRAAESAVKLHPHPFYRAGIQSCAHLLQLLDRDEAAIDLLKKAAEAIQNGPVVAQLYGLLTENGRWQEAADTLERYVQLSPMLEKQFQTWVAGQRARTAYYLGRRPDAAQKAREANDEFNLAFAKRLTEPAPSLERVRLEVPFVRQHFKTCAPATQAALGKFWQLPADHLQMVEAVCYDGTPRSKQRDWSEQNGWIVREFQVTWESAVALLARGIPFAISTVEATSSHMQAVMGFDLTRQALYLRDPHQPYALEWPVDRFFKRYQAFGPSGMVFLPQSDAARLEGLELPATKIYDERHVFDMALSRYDRPTAELALTRLQQNHPDHFITWEVRQQLATYDGNSAEEILCLDRLLEIFPSTPGRILHRLAVMRTATREDKIEFLKPACDAKATDPVLFFELARLLAADARQLETAKQWLRRGFRFRPLDSNGVNVLAMVYWSEGRYALATELYRFAATLENFRESAYQTWFSACRQTGQTDQALRHLRDRFNRFGKRSSQPAFTLAWALQELEQPQTASEVLAEARRLRPNDDHLLLRSAALQAKLGNKELAIKILAETQGKVRENDRLRTGAEIAEIGSDTTTALNFAREITRIEPTAVDAHSSVARNLSIREGRQAAEEYLAQVCATHPNHVALRRTYIDWVRGINHSKVLAATDQILKLSPSDAWTRRERAWALTNLNRLPEALSEAEEAARIEPRQSSSPALVGRIMVLLGQTEPARLQFRSAVELDVDNRSAVNSLLSLATTDKARKDELSFIEGELVRQVVSGDGLLVFGEVARPLLEPDALLKILSAAHAARPDLWHAWSALIDQLLHLSRLDEALDLANQSVRRFPHMPRMWLGLATIHQRRQEAEAEIAAAQRAFDINPAWNQSAFALAGALERHRTLEDARKVFERALHHSPKNASLHANLGFVLWRLRQPQEALASMEQALQINPDFNWAWSHYHDWCRQTGQPRRVAEFARELTRQRPGEAAVWMMLAKTLEDDEHFAERLAAVNKALELEPYSILNWDFKIEILTKEEDFTAAIAAGNQALAACSTDQYIIRGRLAWIDSQRNQLADAVRSMRAILADNASYVWGWQQLCLWLVHQKAFVDAEYAIEQLLKLQPQNQWALGQLASIRLQRDDRIGAEKVFSEVLKTAPTDQNAAEKLFDLQLAAANLTGAATTLGLLQMHHPGTRTTALEIRLLLRQGNRPAAIKALAGLVQQPDQDAWPISAAVEAFKSAGHSRSSFKIIKSALRSNLCHPQAAALGIQILTDQKQGLRALWWFGRIQSAKARNAAAPVIIAGLAKLNDRLLFRFLCWRYREAFRNDDFAWGKVGFGLAHFRRMRAVVAWMIDWRDRSQLEPWMLFNYCYALRHLGRYEEAAQAVNYAINRWGHRHQNAADLRLFLAVEQALAGETKAALDNLQQTHVRSNVAYDRQLQAIAKSLVEFHQMALENRPVLMASIRQRLDLQISAGQLLNGERDVRRTFRRAAKVMSQAGAGWQARLYFIWKLNWQWSLLPLLFVFMAMIIAQPPTLVPVFMGFLIYQAVKGSRRKK